MGGDLLPLRLLRPYNREAFLEKIRAIHPMCREPDGYELMKTILDYIKGTAEINGEIVLLVERTIDELRLPSHMINQTEYIDTKEVADYFGLSTDTAREWVKKKILPGLLIGGKRGRYLIPRDALDGLKNIKNES